MARSTNALLVSAAELARLRGVSRAAIRKAVDTGRITPAAVDQRGRELFDPAAVAAQWDANTDPAKVRGNERAKHDYRREAAREKKAKADLAELEVAERAGKLVDAKEFRVLFTTMVTTARNRLLAIPSKAKGRIPHLTVDEIGILTELIREALEDIADDRV